MPTKLISYLSHVSEDLTLEARSVGSGVKLLAGSATYWWCDIGPLIQYYKPSLPHLQSGDGVNSYTTGSLIEFNKILSRKHLTQCLAQKNPQ